MGLGLRRAFLTFALFLAFLATHAAHAASCSGTGSRTFSVSTCPISAIDVYKSPIAVNLVASYTGADIFEMWVAATSTNGDFSHSVGGVIRGNTVELQVVPSDALTVGVHIGTLTLTFCANQTCSKVLAAVGIPYRLNVITAPAIAKLQPAYVTVGQKPFSLVVTGNYFKTGYRIRFGTTLLTTRVVSSTELTATVDLSTVTTGGSYNVQVISTIAGYNSGVASFTLKNPAPVLTTISPGYVYTGAAPFTLTLNGSGFVSTSRILMDGKALTTHYVSSRQLKVNTNLTAAAAGNHVFSVSSGAPGGGNSAGQTLHIVNAKPVITSLSPSKTAMTIMYESIAVNGTGFEKNSVVRWNGANLPTTYVSPTQLRATTLFLSLLNAASVTLDVVTPSPGGGTSNGATFEVDAPAPSVRWASPGRVYAGSGDVTVTVEGENLIKTTYLVFNGVRLDPPVFPIYGSPKIAQVTLPASALTTATAGTLAVITPGPGGGEVDWPFAIVQHPPQITSLSPGYALPAGADFTLTLDGVDFDSAAQVYWNGSPLVVSQVSSSQIQATVPAADVASAGVASITVVNPVAAGGVSASASFAIDPSGSTVLAMAQPLNDMEWDPTQSIFYGAVPASAVTDPHSIVSLDPTDGAVIGSVDTTDEPILLSLAADDSYLYAAFTSLSGGTNSYGRYSLPGFTRDLDVHLLVMGNGQPQYVKGLQVSPLNAHAYALIIGEPGAPTSNIGATFTLEGYDSWSGSGEPWTTLAWGGDGTHLYGGDAESGTASFFDEVFTDDVYPGGGHVVPGAWTGGRMHVDAASGLIFADDSTAVIDPTTGTATANFPVSGVMVPDSSLGCAYFIVQTPAQVTAAAGDWTLACYSTADYTTLIRSKVIPAVIGTPTKMMRWGNEGLAFMTDGGYVYFVSGQVVAGQ